MNTTLHLLGESTYAFANPYQDVRGWRVRDSSGVDLGHLEDVLVDETAQKVRFLKVAHGGILGFGTSHSFIPIEAVVSVANGEITVEPSAQRVAGAPRFDPVVVDRQQPFDDLYHHYGYRPQYGYPPPWAPAPAVGLRPGERP